MNEEQKESFAYFKTQLPELMKKYKDKYLVLEGQAVKGFFDSFATALEWAAKNCKDGSFIIQQVTNEKDQINFLSPAI